MGIHTCSGAVSLSRELEIESAKFYQEFSNRYEQNKELFISFAKESEKYIKQIERAYYEVITDAIEGCFAFDLNPEDYRIKNTLSKDTGYAEAVAEALKMEEVLLRFYRLAAEQSKHLMADVPMAFLSVAKKRSERLSKLTSLLEK